MDHFCAEDNDMNLQHKDSEVLTLHINKKKSTLIAIY